MRPSLLLAVYVASVSPLLAETPIDLTKIPLAAAGSMDFQKDIAPIFARACLSCHGVEKQRAGVRLDRAAAAFNGGNSGPFILPKDALKSRLLHVISGADADVFMPPKDKPALTQVEVAKIRAWIEQGAIWPKSEPEAFATDKKTAHWAFQPIRRPALPNRKQAAWGRNGIDAFIFEKLIKENVLPSVEADRITLIRRLSLDLLGLPPTPEEVDAFRDDASPDAYERLVDRLLASPHYGERWGRHWLDSARYADSDGYEQDRERMNAWRYRNWVIDAFNRDLAFDQFTIEQLAGDLLPNATLEQKTATGFHRNTLTNREGGTDKEQFRVEACVDRVSTTAKVWLGVTMNCCQCHDHKYDPFSQREFYQFFAFFNSDSEVDVPIVPKGPEEMKFKVAQAAFEKKKAELANRLAEYKKAGLPASLMAWEKGLSAEERQKVPANVQVILEVPAAKRTPQHRGELDIYFAKLDAKLIELNKAVADHEKTAPPQGVVPTLAMTTPRKTHILLRGDFLRPGVEVSPAPPSVLGSFKSDAKPTRLDLARWLVGPDNPLTSRVIANWVWHYYFGRGIVPTLEDFGTQGERPSHPELLDYLATEFVARGWSLKELHKLIVTSATYRQTSKARPELVGRDPYNVWLARQNRLRLEAEILRDNALAVSGLLVPKIGGPSVKPPQPAGISELTYASRAKWVESAGPDRFRRGMYTWFQRTSPYPMLMTFDAPDSNLSCVRREKSNTPLQALTLLNDTAFVETAQALGRRIMQEKPGDSTERLTHAFRLTLAREPNERELAVLSNLYEDLLREARKDAKEAARLAGPRPGNANDLPESATWTALARMLLNLDEFMTRE